MRQQPVRSSQLVFRSQDVSCPAGTVCHQCPCCQQWFCTDRSAVCSTKNNVFVKNGAPAKPCGQTCPEGNYQKLNGDCVPCANFKTCSKAETALREGHCRHCYRDHKQI